MLARRLLALPNHPALSDTRHYPKLGLAQGDPSGEIKAESVAPML
jgi:hypothetical protein